MGLTPAVYVTFRWSIYYAKTVIPVNNAVFFPWGFVKSVFLKCIKQLFKIPLQDPNNAVFAKPKNKHPREKQTVKKAIHKNHLTYQHTKNSEENRITHHINLLGGESSTNLFPFPSIPMGEELPIWLLFLGLRLGLKHSPTNQPPSLPRCASGMSRFVGS